MRILILSCLLLAGCATLFPPKQKVLIDAMAGRPSKGSKVYIEDRTSHSDLEKNYFTAYVQAALKRSGYNVVQMPSEADYIVYFRYGSKSYEKIASEPVYKWVAPKRYTVTNSTYTPYGTTNSHGTFTEDGGGDIEQTGTRTYSYTSYTPFILMVAYDVKDIVSNMAQNIKAPEIWKISAVTDSLSPDMRKAFPVLLSGAIPYVGQDTNGFLETPVGKQEVKALEESLNIAKVRAPSGQ